MIRVDFLLLLLFSVVESKIRFQSIGVKGTLLCGDAPTPGIRVRLWDNDIGELVDSPKQSSFTDFDGKFEFDDWTPYNDEVDPVIRIAHDCNDGVKPGQRLFKFKIPKTYVVEGKETPKEKFFNLGTVNLEFKPYNEERYNKGDIGKRHIIQPLAHKLHRVRRHENVVTKPVKTDKKTTTDDSSEDDPCDFGLCTFSEDRKRRGLEETSKSDEIVNKEESAEDEGCASEGACLIHLTRKRRAHRRAIERQNAVEEDSKSDEIVKKEEDSGCSDGACPIDLSRKRRANRRATEHQETADSNSSEIKKKLDDASCSGGSCSIDFSRKRRANRRAVEQNTVDEDSKSDEIIKKEDDSGCSDGACPIDFSRKRRANRRAIERQQTIDEASNSDEIVKKEDKSDSGCSDGACPIDLSRKRRDEDPDADCGEVNCPLHINNAKKNATTPSSKFGGRDESPEDRNEPW